MALLSSVTTVMIAGRIMHVVYCLVYAGGAFFFVRRFCHANYAPGAVLLLWLPSFFFWRGYINYYMGVACFLAAGAAAESVRVRYGATTSACVDAALALLLYATHFFAAAAFIMLRFSVYVAALSWPQALRRITLIGLLAAGVALWYRLGISGETFDWHFGSGLWKGELVKKSLTMPYAAPLHSQAVISFQNIHNAVVILLWVACALATAHEIGRRCRDPRGLLRHPLFLTGVMLFLSYVVLPSRVGKRDADMRIFFPLALLVAAWGSGRIYGLLPKWKRLVTAGIVVLLTTSFVLSFYQFRLSQPLIGYHVARGMTGRRRMEPVSINQRLMIAGAAGRNRVRALLEPLKLHTDVRNWYLPELHCDAYYYFAGGRLRGFTDASLIRKADDGPP
jgi:hypothetical protein